MLFMTLANFSGIISSFFKALTPLLWYSHYTVLVHLMLSSPSVSRFIVFILLSSILETVLQDCQFMFFYYFSNSWWTLRLFFLQEKFFSFIYFFPNYCFYFWVNHIVIYPQRKALLINSSETEVFQYRYMVNDNIVVWFPLYFLFFLIFIFTIFYFTLLYWFCHTLTWIHHGCTWVPNPEP